MGQDKNKTRAKKKDISSPIIKIALTEIDEDNYFATLHDLAEKKFHLIKEADPFKKKKKLSDHLLRKGYEANLVFEISNNFFE